jgi:hypothetical protein
LTGFYSAYAAVFTAIKTALVYVPAVAPHNGDPGSPAQGVESVGTVLLDEQFTPGALPVAIINAEPSPVGQATMGSLLEVRVRGSIVLVLRDYAPANWFTDVITVMGAVADAILADRSLGGSCFDCYLTGFSPGEIKFNQVKDKLFYGGVVRFEAAVNYAP